MSKKKMAFLINSLTHGGAERVISSIVPVLYKDGYDIELICLERDDFYSIDKDIKITYLSDFDGKENSILKLFMIFILAFKLKSHLYKNSIDLVQSHLFRSNYVNTMAKLFGSKHIVQLVSAVSAKSKYGNGRVSSKINLFLIKNLYKYADLLIFKAKAMHDEYIESFNFKNESIVIYNPVNINTIDRLKLDSDKHKFEFDQNKKYIISIGRFHKQKRQKDLIDAFVKIEENYQDLEIIFLGDGERRSILEEYTKEIKLESKIHFLGNVSNPYYYLYNSYIYISSSGSEGFPNALVEAMCCGLPVISADCMTGPREILAPNTDYKCLLEDRIEKAKYGILYPVADINGLVDSMKILLTNNNIYTYYKNIVRDRVKDFEFDEILSEYKKVLEIENSNSYK